MSLRFETQPSLTNGKEIPILVDIESVSEDMEIQNVLVNGNKVAIDDTTLRRLAHVVSRMSTERLPKQHFRDCIHFVMAMSGVWLPTSHSLARGRRIEQVCDSSGLVQEPVGPVSAGIPNDERCLGFDGEPYIYLHAAVGAQTSNGVLYVQKLGTDDHFGLATSQEMLSYYDLDVVHPIQELTLRDGDTITHWPAQEKTPTQG